MIRTLAMIAIAGFLVSLATLSVAVGMVGPAAIAQGAWSFGPNGWGDHGSGDGDVRRDDVQGGDSGPQVQRRIAWDDGDSLDVDLSADIRYAQAPGPAKLTVSGPQDAVADVQVDDGHIRYRRDREHDGPLTIVLTAPSVTHFRMDGSGKLVIVDYRQQQLDLDLQGATDVTATGDARAIQLAITGSGSADLGGVKAQSAKVALAGSGDARLAPTSAADVNISGSGNVTLLTHPANLQSEISGSGHVLGAGNSPAS